MTVRNVFSLKEATLDLIAFIYVVQFEIAPFLFRKLSKYKASVRHISDNGKGKQHRNYTITCHKSSPNLNFEQTINFIFSVLYQGRPLNLLSFFPQLQICLLDLSDP